MIRVRAATTADIEQITDIYAHHVRQGVATFEEVAPTSAQMAERMLKVLQHGLPYLALEHDAAILGYAYAGPYNMRSAYRYCVEDSIYLRADSLGQGHGKTLLSALLTACEARGMRQMVALISGPSGPSHQLHRRFGFTDSGVLHAIGYKFGTWQNVTMFQRALGPGADAPPSAKGGILGL